MNAALRQYERTSSGFDPHCGFDPHVTRTAVPLVPVRKGPVPDDPPHACGAHSAPQRTCAVLTPSFARVRALAPVLLR